MFALAPPAPGWATPTRGDRTGVTRPNAREFGRFAKAAARRFPGVDVWTIWNEPNHPGHLYPQSTTERPPRGRPPLPRAWCAPRCAGSRAAARARDPILFGELLPIGKPVDRAEAQPEAAALPARVLLRPRDQRPRRVRLPPLHALRRPARARALGRRRDDPLATAASCGRSTRRGRAASCARSGSSRSGTPSSASRRTRPTRSARASASVPRFWSISELWLSYSNRRVKSISQYTMNDQPGDPSLWQSGLRFANGSPRRTSTRTTACRSSSASSAPARSRCAAPRGQFGAGAQRPDIPARPQGRLQAARRRRSRSATCAATSWRATGSRARPGEPSASPRQENRASRSSQ